MSKFDKYQHGNFGFITLSDLVDQYFIYTHNDGQKNLENILLIAKNVWKKIYWRELRMAKHKILRVDKNTNTIAWPLDAIMINAVDVIDKNGRFVPLYIDNTINTETLEPISKGCGCKECGCDNDVCGTLSNSYQEEDVLIDGDIYKKITKARICPNGDIMQEITEPFAVKVDDVMVVQMRTKESIVDKVEVKSCGCIVNTPVIKNICYGICGWPQKDRWCGPRQHSNRGYYKVDSELKLIHIMNCDTLSAMVHFVSDGEDCAKQILIPEYAIEAVVAGTAHGAIRFRLNVNRGDKIDFKSQYESEVTEMIQFLNPIKKEDFLDLQNIMHEW